MQLKDYPDILTTRDLMDILHIGKNVAYRLLKEGTIKSHRIGHKFLIPKCCVYDYIKSAQQKRF